MKHYNIPIFLPGLACRFRCVYCDQNSITNRQSAPDPQDVVEIVTSHLETFDKKGFPYEAEIAFFGGTFTALPEKLQDAYLDAVKPFLENKKVVRLRCSTRPDSITAQRVRVLKERGMATIELGAQSTNDAVLQRCGRGHTAEDIRRASEIILNEGITLGLQMMTGLPGSSRELDLKTAHDIVDFGAQETRIYPCVTVRGTALERLYNKGKYTPQNLPEAVDLATELLRFFEEKNVKVLRIGLHTSESLNNGDVVAGPYHPNFAEMVLAERQRQLIENEISCQNDEKNSVLFITASKGMMNSVAGFQQTNLKKWRQRFKDVVLIENDSVEKPLVECVETSFPSGFCAIVDHRMPPEAMEELQNLTPKILQLPKNNAAYTSINAHPDIFIFQNEKNLIFAPNINPQFLEKIKNYNICFTFGTSPVGDFYPETAHYNASSTSHILIHNPKITDTSIKSQYDKFIPVKQGYTRCNLILINENTAITSDQGIEKTLKKENFNVFYINPKQIKLQGQKNGFFGGCCGYVNHHLVVCGSLRSLKEHTALRRFLSQHKVIVHELMKGECVDVGSIFFVKSTDF